MNIYGLTNVGKVRKNNEDCIYISGDKLPVLAIVADGMGGHLAGQVASKMAVDYVVKAAKGFGLMLLNADIYGRLISQANYHIYDTASKDAELYQMGTTFTSVIAQKDKLIVANVGDSRSYLYHKGILTRLTHDHSFVQGLIDQHVITEKEARNHPYRNIITRALGMEKVEVDVQEVGLSFGDVVLLCSDGLINHVDDREIAYVVSRYDSSVSIVNHLMKLALDRGGKDNISIICLINDGGDVD